MKHHLDQLREACTKALQEISNVLDLENLEQRFFSRKSGELTALMKNLKELPDAERKECGKLINDLKGELEQMFDSKKTVLKMSAMGNLADTEGLDVTQPKLPPHERGHIHPITQVQNQLEDLFTSMGFMVLDGPELESEYYNFTALNVPADHPARDMQDTFYIKHHPDWVMRTQTSSLQVRAMETYGAPLRAIVPGRCFRNEATDPRHEHTFYQLEGLVIDTHITFSHMKGVFQQVADCLFGSGTKIRLMPKFYPFVEPGVRGEVSCFLCKGRGCRVCKQTGWLEVMPGGLVHPHVLRAGGLDPEKYSGFAFGFGLTRLAMLKYGIEDVRHFQSGDMSFLKQF